MADKLSQLVLDALARAALAPGGTPLVGGKAAPGLFAATSLGKQAAQKARDDGLIRQVAADPKGKPDRDLYAATAAGIDFLLRQTSPKQVLDDLARAVEARHAQFTEWLTVARDTHAELAAVREILARVAPALGELGGDPAALGTPATGGYSVDDQTPVAGVPSAAGSPPGSPDCLTDLRTHLAEWDDAGDCPLPELYARVRAAHPALTIGQFHDGLRELHDREQVYLHPWTGPLYALPEPAFALLVGHEVAYYASERGSDALDEHQTNGVVSRRFAEA